MVLLRVAQLIKTIKYIRSKNNNNNRRLAEAPEPNLLPVKESAVGCKTKKNLHNLALESTKITLSNYRQDKVTAQAL